MMTNNIAVILAALIGSLSGLLALFFGRRKLLAEVGKLKAETGEAKADEAEKLTRIAMGLLEPLQNRVAELEKAVREMGDKLERSHRIVRALLRGTALLIHQLREVGGDVTPVFIVPLFEEGADTEEIERIILRGLA